MFIKSAFLVFLVILWVDSSDGKFVNFLVATGATAAVAACNSPSVMGLPSHSDVDNHPATDKCVPVIDILQGQFIRMSMNSSACKLFNGRMMRNVLTLPCPPEKEKCDTACANRPREDVFDVTLMGPEFWLERLGHCTSPPVFNETDGLEYFEIVATANRFPDVFGNYGDQVDRIHVKVRLSFKRLLAGSLEVVSKDSRHDFNFTGDSGIAPKLKVTFRDTVPKAGFNSLDTAVLKIYLEDAFRGSVEVIGLTFSLPYLPGVKDKVVVENGMLHPSYGVLFIAQEKATDGSLLVKIAFPVMGNEEMPMIFRITIKGKVVKSWADHGPVRRLFEWSYALLFGKRELATRPKDYVNHEIDVLVNNHPLPGMAPSPVWPLPLTPSSAWYHLPPPGPVPSTNLSRTSITPSSTNMDDVDDSAWASFLSWLFEWWENPGVTFFAGFFVSVMLGVLVYKIRSCTSRLCRKVSVETRADNGSPAPNDVIPEASTAISVRGGSSNQDNDSASAPSIEAQSEPINGGASSQQSTPAKQDGQQYRRVRQHNDSASAPSIEVQSEPTNGGARRVEVERCIFQ
eukprot:g79.t1